MPDEWGKGIRELCKVYEFLSVSISASLLMCARRLEIGETRGSILGSVSGGKVDL